MNFSLAKSMLLLSIFGGLCSCINDDVPAGTSEVGKDDPDGNVVFELIVPNNTSSLTKVSETTETSGIYDTGSVDEYRVHNVTVYLFDAVSGIFRQSFTLYNLDLKQGSPIASGEVSSTENVSSVQSDHQVCYETKKLKVDEEGVYNIYAIANANYGQPQNETEFLSAIDESNYMDGWVNLNTDRGFIMTTRADNSGLYGSEYKNKNRNVQLHKNLTTAEPPHVKLLLERVVAKVLVGRTDDSFPLRKPNDSTYAKIVLSDYYPINLARKFYRHRHVANFSSFPSNIPTTIPTNFGEVTASDGYVVDPYFLKKTVEGADGFRNPDGYYAYPLGGNRGTWKQINTGTFSYFYCLENCMYQTAQKNAYSTGVHFRAKVMPTKIVTANEEEVLSTNSNTLFYANYTFFDSWDALKTKVDVANTGLTADSSDSDLAAWGIKRFKREDDNFYCYYNYWIRHLDNNSPKMGVMEFAIVRNNIYRLMVSGISSLGSGSPEITPGKDDEYDIPLEISFCVLPWIVRNQGGSNGVTL
ncbi:MAG: Mfa1 family fimbria major subunit [Parabacteroides sp.]